MYPGGKQQDLSPRCTQWDKYLKIVVAINISRKKSYLNVKQYITILCTSKFHTNESNFKLTNSQKWRYNLVFH